MHYCLMLLSKEFPTEEKIEELMMKYNCEMFDEEDDKYDEYPQFTWDWYVLGGRYNGRIKLKFDTDNETYRWRYIERTPRNGRLFWSHLLTDMEKFSQNSMYCEEDYFNSMGANDGYIYVDGARIGDIINFDTIDCYTFMTDDGKAYSKECWNGDDFICNDDFEEQLKLAKDKAQEENQFVTIIDYHF